MKFKVFFFDILIFYFNIVCIIYDGNRFVIYRNIKRDIIIIFWNRGYFILYFGYILNVYMIGCGFFFVFYVCLYLFIY